MPFTPTHALAVVPLARFRALTPSALAIGSMIPDLWAFMPRAPSYATSHSWLWGPITGVFYGLIAFVIFRVCRGPAIAFAPEHARRKLSRYSLHELQMSVRGWASVVLSLVLGVWTHILWDSFTHGNTVGMTWFPQLTSELFSIGRQPVRGYKVLQLASTAVGLPTLAWLIARWYARLPANGSATIGPASSKLRALGIAVVVGAPLAALCASWSASFMEPIAFERFVRLVVTRTMSLYALGFVLLTLATRRAYGQRDCAERS